MEILSPQKYEKKQKYIFISNEFVSLSSYLAKNLKHPIVFEVLQNTIKIRTSNNGFTYHAYTGHINNSSGLSDDLKAFFKIPFGTYIYFDKNLESIQQTKYSCLLDYNLGIE